MPDLDFRVRKAAGEARVVELSGFIDAATIETLEKLLAKLERKQFKQLVFDFAQVGYVNSMGIAAFLNFREAVGAHGCTVAIAAADREVSVTMENLGLSQLVPMYARVSDALLGKAPQKALGARRRIRRQPAVENGNRVAAILVSPKADHFTDVCQMRLGHSSKAFDIVHSAQAAREKMDRVHYGLLILEDRLPDAEQLLSDVKSSVKGGLMSVLKLYPNGTNLGRFDDFKIWENDYLIEPFEVRELFVMAERELARVPGERRETLQQTRFRFRTSGRNVARAISLIESLVAQSGFDEHSAIKVMSAAKEGIDNAVRHGNRNDATKSIEIVYILKGNRVELSVTDDGDGFDWSPYLERARAGDAFRLARQAKQAGKRGGLGIKIMFECSDELRYSDTGNSLFLVKKLV